MTHAQWHARIRESLAMVEDQPARALRSLHKLLDRLAADVRKDVSEWHIEQTLETVSIIHSHLRDHRHSAETMLLVAERHEQQLLYSRRALVAACAAAALELAAAGDRAAARRALRRARAWAPGLRPPEKLFRKAETVVSAMPRRR